ncbi:MAG: hypothetical protein ACFB5Z_14500 [Elainellaceae cyanobacterium]
MLKKIEDAYPNYQERFFDGREVVGLNVMVSGDRATVGTVSTILVDSDDQFKYLVIDVGAFSTEQRLLSMKHCRIDLDSQCIVTSYIQKQRQVDSLPLFDPDNLSDLSVADPA